MNDEEQEFNDESNLEAIEDDAGLGSIQINNNVVANIVAMAAREVPGVWGLARGDFRDDLKGLFNKRDSSVSVEEGEDGRYLIRVKVILVFGVRLAKVAGEIQTVVREQVENMTDKDVARVDIVVDEVRHPKAPGEEEEEG